MFKFDSDLLLSYYNGAEIKDTNFDNLYGYLTNI